MQEWQRIYDMAYSDVTEALHGLAKAHNRFDPKDTPGVIVTKLRLDDVISQPVHDLFHQLRRVNEIVQDMPMEPPPAILAKNVESARVLRNKLQDLTRLQNS